MTGSNKTSPLNRRELILGGGMLTSFSALGLTPSQAQDSFESKKPGNYSGGELVNSGHRFFGSTTRGLASVIESATSKWGHPNGYILGQEGSGAFVAGLRYGEGTLYTKSFGDSRIFWQGPSIGFDAGGDGDRTMILVYRLKSPDEMYHRFIGVDGSAYLVGGVGMTLLTSDNIWIAPIRTGLGARLGINVGYLKFTSSATWNPF